MKNKNNQINNVDLNNRQPQTDNKEKIAIKPIVNWIKFTGAVVPPTKAPMWLLVSAETL